MFDEIAIQQTLNRYSEGASRADLQQVLATFAPDGIYEAAGVRLEGHAAIAAATSAYVAAFAYLVQVNAPAVISIDGDHARARSVIRECAKYADRDEVLEVVGIYSDELTRTSQGWRLTFRSFGSLGAYTYSASPYVAPAQPMQLAPGRWTLRTAVRVVLGPQGWRTTRLGSPGASHSPPTSARRLRRRRKDAVAWLCA